MKTQLFKKTRKHLNVEAQIHERLKKLARSKGMLLEAVTERVIEAGLKTEEAK